jgi:hypothetical protein
MLIKNGLLLDYSTVKINVDFSGVFFYLHSAVQITHFVLFFFFKCKKQLLWSLALILLPAEKKNLVPCFAGCLLCRSQKREANAIF